VHDGPLCEHPQRSKWARLHGRRKLHKWDGEGRRYMPERCLSEGRHQVLRAVRLQGIRLRRQLWPGNDGGERLLRSLRREHAALLWRQLFFWHVLQRPLLPEWPRMEWQCLRLSPGNARLRWEPLRFNLDVLSAVRRLRDLRQRSLQEYVRRRPAVYQQAML
jgi:hypothetical protein